jgi:hypothetical protein
MIERFGEGFRLGDVVGAIRVAVHDHVDHFSVKTVVFDQQNSHYPALLCCCLLFGPRIPSGLSCFAW